MKNSRKKIRKSTRYFYMFVTVVLLIISTVYLYTALFSTNLNTNKLNIYSYSNNFNCEYNVKLLNNNYIDEESIDMADIYVTDLIDYIDMKLNYTYSATEESSLSYTYEVIGVLNAKYNIDEKDETIWEKEFSIIPTKTNTTTDKSIVINEDIKLNLKEQNLLVKNFQNSLNINVIATYNVILKVYVNTDFKGTEVKSDYDNTISIDLGKKATQVKGKLNDEYSNSVTQDVVESTHGNIVGIIISIITFLMSAIVLKRLYSKTTTSNIIKNEYKYELNKILRICQDKIVQVSSTLEINKTQVIDVKDFGEIIKVSEELFKPILHWTSKEDEESWFCVMSNNVTYRYILNKQIM